MFVFHTLYVNSIEYLLLTRQHGCFHHRGSEFVSNSCHSNHIRTIFHQSHQSRDHALRARSFKHFPTFFGRSQSIKLNFMKRV